MQLKTTILRLVLLLTLILSQPSAGLAQEDLQTARRIVFLGDSITYSGEYIAMVEAALRVQDPEREFDFLDLGLPSETVSGLSEPGHAGGKFPRPDLHERLERLLEKTKPDLVIAFYGMNCGIYHPYSDDRFEAYRAGIRRLREKVHSAKAKLILLTPPVFDPLPISAQTLPAGETVYRQPYRGYNQVLDLYASWIMAAQSEGWQAIDTHTPLNAFLADKRQTDSKFTVAPDGVHLNSAGHWLVAREIIRTLGVKRLDTSAENVVDGFAAVGEIAPILEQIKTRQKRLSDSWLTEVGHLRPGMSKGGPVAEATELAKNLDAEIKELAKKISPFPGTQSDWNGFRRFDFDCEGAMATVVVPDRVERGKPWVWHGEFFGHKPEPDIELLKRGFHIVYLRVPDLFGSPKAVASWNQLYERLTKSHGLAPKVGLIGLSRGGLYCYNWAIANPEKVACIYADAPVCDFKSWPGGRGKGVGSAEEWKRLLTAFEFQSEAEAIAYDGNPIDRLQPLVGEKIPLLHVFGDADKVVPWEENTGLLTSRYQALGGIIHLIRKPGIEHHPHGLDDPTPIVEFLYLNCLRANRGAK
jgi:lysophospholipase L1-like esterase/pimeloyl-ACP methyl ester carboxylesterase